MGLRFRLHLRLLPLLIAALAAGLTACGGSGSGSADATTVVSVRERDFAIALAPRVVPAGAVDFRSHNRGPDAHELIVVRESSAAGLPFRADGITIDEDALKRVTIGVLEPGEPGSVRDLRVRLSPGRYVLFCNMAGHFMGGMHTTMVVR